VSKKIAVIGGGPGGLFAARLLKVARPDWHVDVYERNPASAVYGFGVGLGGQVMDGVRAADPELHDDIVAAGLTTDSVQRITTDRGTSTWTWGGWHVLAISRSRLLGAFRERAEFAGVHLHHEQSVELDDVRDADVILASDGAKSTVRTQLADQLHPNLRLGRLRTIWLGAKADPPIDTSMFVIRSDEHGVWALHAYPHGDGMATLVVETDPATLRSAGISYDDAAPDERGTINDADPNGYGHLSRLFADQLGGAELLTSNSRWFRFDTVVNDSWVTDKVALLGDAAHTAHPSIGSGTRMAMEDAEAVARSLLANDDVPAALQAYQRERQPLVGHLQRAALPSQRWWETVDERLNLDPDRLALHYISRTGFYPLSRFAPRDPGLVERATKQFRAGVAPTVGAAHRSGSEDVLATPVQLGGVLLDGRVVQRFTTWTGGNDQNDDISSATGLVLMDDAPETEWSQLGDAARFGAAVAHTTTDERLATLRSAGVHVLEIATPLDRVGSNELEAAADLGRKWSAFDVSSGSNSVALIRVTLTIDDPDDDSLSTLGDRLRGLRDAFDGVSLEVRQSTDLRRMPGRSFQLADRLRRRSGLSTLLWADPSEIEQMRTALVVGRVDLVGIGTS
jgi:anthraniloyl-CoA monooxygenase